MCLLGLLRKGGDRKVIIQLTMTSYHRQGSQESASRPSYFREREALQMSMGQRMQVQMEFRQKKKGKHTRSIIELTPDHSKHLSSQLSQTKCTKQCSTGYRKSLREKINDRLGEKQNHVKHNTSIRKGDSSRTVKVESQIHKMLFSTQTEQPPLHLHSPSLTDKHPTKPKPRQQFETRQLQSLKLRTKNRNLLKTELHNLQMKECTFKPTFTKYYPL